MEVKQHCFTAAHGWNKPLVQDPQSKLVLIFADRSLADKKDILVELREVYPQAQFAGCTTAGEILGTEVREESLIATSVRFQEAYVKSTSVNLDLAGGSFGAGRTIADRLLSPDLKHLLLFSDGLNVNGSDLIAGARRQLNGTLISGGLSGDGALFEQCFVLDNEGFRPQVVVGVGLYGDSLVSSAASNGGWDSFGPERFVTRSEGSKLFELDGEPALHLYRNYLGDQASELPASGLLFPLSIKNQERQIVRTILSVSEEEGSITFAGDIQQGSQVQLMRANTERLVEGAGLAAEWALEEIEKHSVTLALLISCVGRKMVLKQRVEEELECVQTKLPHQTALTGFYSYGELAPSRRGEPCLLHNQTMTISLIGEK